MSEYFKNSPLFALAKPKKTHHQRYEIFFLKVDEDIIDELRELFSSGITYYSNKERCSFTNLPSVNSDESLCIENYIIPKEVSSELAKGEGSQIEITANHFKEYDIKALFMYDYDLNLYSFKRITADNYFISNQLLLFFTGKQYNKFDSNIISIPDETTAIYIDNTLLFDNYNSAKSILDLSEYYKQASEDDVNTLMSKTIFYNQTKAKKYLLERPSLSRLVAMIIDNKVLNKYTTEYIVELAQTHNIELEVDEKTQKIIIDWEDPQKLKKTLRFLTQHTFLTTFDHKPAMANGMVLI